MSPALVGKSSHDSQSSLRGKKEGKLQKIGDFLNSSPTFLGSKGESRGERVQDTKFSISQGLKLLQLTPPSLPVMWRMNSELL